jgi:putative transposase
VSEAWRLRGVSVTYYQQKAELPGIKEALPEYSEVNSQVLQDVVLRVDRAFQPFFRRIKAGQTAGYPRFQGRDRYNSFTYPQVGEHGSAALDGGLLSLSRSDVFPFACTVRWRGRLRLSRSAEKPMVGMCLSPVSLCPYNRFPPPDSRPA